MKPKTLTDLEIAIKLEEIEKEETMKQTAVDYLFEKLWTFPKDKMVWQHYFQKAKQMEKEQIKEAYKIVDLDIQHEDVGEINSEQYYQETYENES